MHGDAPVSPTLFRSVCGQFATGVAIATMGTKETDRWGLTVNSFSSVSLDPPLVLFSIDKDASCHDAFTSSQSFGINILSATQKDLSDRFSFVKDEDRFEGIDLIPGTPEEPPLIAGCMGHIVCTLHQTVAGGDHTILIGKVRHIALSDDKTIKPLLYFSGDYAELAT